MRYDNILVEINLKNLQFKNPIKLTMNFENNIIGSALLTRKDNGIYAEILSQKDLFGLYPCLGFTYYNEDIQNGVIDELSMCITQNQDLKITSL